MMTTYGTPFFFLKKKRKKKKRKIQQPLLKFSIKIHICIIIHFKAMREDGASAEASPRVFLNEAGGILRGIAFPFGEF